MLSQDRERKREHTKLTNTLKHCISLWTLAVCVCFVLFWFGSFISIKLNFFNSNSDFSFPVHFYANLHATYIFFSECFMRVWCWMRNTKGSHSAHTKIHKKSYCGHKWFQIAMHTHNKGEFGKMKCYRYHEETRNKHTYIYEHRRYRLIDTQE